MEAASKPDGGERSHHGSGTDAPGEASMDCYLRSQGLYRKRVAKDGSCLFRAVAEQVTGCLKKAVLGGTTGSGARYWVLMLKCGRVLVKVTQTCTERGGKRGN